MTTTTELALVDDDGTEVVEWQPLNKTDAKKLDRRIRATSDKAIANHEKTLALLDELKELLTQARDGDIHKALGLKSWTAYLADAVNVQVPDREDRKELTQFLSGEGASQRAIAKMLNVSQKTVDRDLEDEQPEDGATVTSLDGAERPKNKPKAEPEQDYLDAEVVEPDEDSEPEPMAAVDIVTGFDTEVANLHAAFSEMNDYLSEDKWGGARKRVAKANLDTIQEIITGLNIIVDDLMTG